MTSDLPAKSSCVFCDIIRGDSPALWEKRPTSRTEAVCFRNRLKWAKVMLLVVPVKHLTQDELWSSDTLIESARLAVEMGNKYCHQYGYRVIANFGVKAHQSQIHAHMHVVSGISRQIKESNFKSHIDTVNGLVTEEYSVQEAPLTVKISPSTNVNQREMWSTDLIVRASLEALRISRQRTPDGYRLMSSFDPAKNSVYVGENPSGLFLMGGGQLGLYV